MTDLVGWVERSETQQKSSQCWVSFLNPTYKLSNLKQINWDRQNEEAYDELVVSLEASSGELNLLIGVCDNSDFREQII